VGKIFASNTPSDAKNMQFRGKVYQTGQKTALRRKKYAQPEFATGDHLPKTNPSIAAKKFL
jgi:hypothetical protein